MSKMKHLLRKLHIGGGGGSGAGGALADPHHPHAHHHHHNHNRGQAVENITSATASSPVEHQTSTSDLPSPATAAEVGQESAENSVNSRSGGASANASDSVPDFGLLEEEFQVQLALAMSVSDSDVREDPETTAQITAAKQISLACSPSQSLVDFQSLRYWNYDVVNYNEKVIDGFYDVYGINSNLVARGKMPSLVELQSIPVLHNVDYEVILVNRMTDMELQRLEEKVCLVANEYQALRVGALMGFFLQKIANIVVEKMGGPVHDAEEMRRRWTTRSYELRTLLNTIVLPLGSLDVGLSRHRALLFKVLADRINLPCLLVKGSYYTSTDDGAFSIIKFDDGSEYIIDLMGAPGTLIPSEIPSGQLQNCGLDLRTITPIADSFDDSCFEFGGSNGPLAVMPGLKVPAKISSSTSEPYFCGMESLGNFGSASKIGEIKQFEHDFGNIIPSLLEIAEESTGGGHNGSAAKQILVEDFSEYVCVAAKNPQSAQRSKPVLLENNTVTSPEDSSNQSPFNLGEQQVMEKNPLLKDEKILNTTPCGTELQNSTAVLAVQRPGQMSDVSKQSNFLGHLSPNVMESGKAVVRVKNDQNSQTNDVLMKRMVIASCIQPSLLTRDEQIDPMLGGVAEWEIPWEDLQIGERIGIGSFGEVYHSDWNGTEVAVKKFMNQDISGDALAQFKCEVEIMLRLRHPNVVLFMGAVTRPPNLSILTEFLPRGSLFKLLHRSLTKVDQARRLRMALDVAKGMNYLHTSHPVIVHRDLKTPNLLVDKNWVVKVCDFGMSRMKHHTFLSSKSTAGTAEWMAPEVLRNEPSNEKSDVFSFGVILWELATKVIPWKGMNSMQVVGAVGFQGRRLTIPDHVDPVVAEIIRNCWDSNQHARPSFKEIITRLKGLQRLVVKEEEDLEMTEQ